MDALVICGALAALVVIAVVSRCLGRRRTDQCRRWLGTDEEEWSGDELDALRSSDVAA